MKVFFTNLLLFVVFCIVFSSFTGCGSGPSATQNGNGSNVAVNTSNAASPTGDSKSSAYPMLSSGLADADIELLDGKTTKISDHKGKMVLVNLWGIWCGPCRAEMPHLIELQDQYRDQGFEILGLNVGDGSQNPEDLSKIKDFGEKMKLNYTLGRINRETTAQVYKITREDVVPQTLLIDREGHLRGVFVGGGPTIAQKLQDTIAKTMSE